MMCDTSVYSLSTQHAMMQLSEKEIPFELIEVSNLFTWYAGLQSCCVMFLLPPSFSPFSLPFSLTPPTLSPGSSDLLQDPQHPGSSAHLSPWLELHLCSPQTSQCTPRVWWVKVTNMYCHCLCASGHFSPSSTLPSLLSFPPYLLPPPLLPSSSSCLSPPPLLPSSSSPSPLFLLLSFPSSPSPLLLHRFAGVCFASVSLTDPPRGPEEGFCSCPRWCHQGTS